MSPALRPDRSNQPQAGETFGSEFLDNVAHQMVAPLQSIEMHCKNIVDGVVPEERRNARLKEVIGHTRVLTELARRMRFLHELVSGKVIDTERLEFASIVTSWISGFNNYLPVIQATGFDADIDLSMNNLPDVLASRLAVHQVIMNLFDNAMKYGSPTTKITVKGRLDRQFVINEFSHEAKVRLTDADAERIFERGFRSEEAKQVSGTGTGIGMWISRQLMRSMQGDLQVIPTSPQGITRFKLKWRLAP